MDWQSVISFWFEEIEAAFWFKKDSQFDQICRERFLETYYQATRCELSHWRDCPQGRLAEIIVLDQFPRNMFRDSSEAFAFDSLAVALTQEAVRAKDDMQLELKQRKFLYMPLMHSESLIVHEQAMKLFAQPGLEDNYRYEIRHKEIIDKFGRYPHRNEVLGRLSTEEEIEFLSKPGSSF